MPTSPSSYLSDNLPSPIFEFTDTTHIGTGALIGQEDESDGTHTIDTIYGIHTITSTGTRNGIRLLEARVPDGSSADDVVNMLLHITPDNVVFLVTFPDQPTVNVIEGSGETFKAATRHAVQLINSFLPYERQILFEESSVPAPGTTQNVPEGHIYVEFTPQSWWQGSFAENSVPSTLGLTDIVNKIDDATAKNNERRSALILVNSDSERDPTQRDLSHIVVHEMLHAIGFWGHSYYPRSVLSPTFYNSGLSFLIPLDRDAVHAGFTRFKPGVQFGREITTENLGPWESTSSHLRGQFEVPEVGQFWGDDVLFGVYTRNGLAQPYTVGPRPTGSLSDNRLLSGTARWEGVILGYTPSERKVIGDARLDVRLDNLSSGELWFSGLEYDNTQTWSDGDLEYTVHIEKNTFSNYGRSSKDAGDVTGAFFGRNHEGMGGVLRRQDLTGAFGGKR